METLFDTDRKGFIEETYNHDGHTCRDCRHRECWALNEFSQKVIQCCNLQRSKRSNSGYKTIKVTDRACWLWSPIIKDNENEV